MTLTEIRKRLEALADEEYRKFQAGLLPGTANIVGVRIPHLRKLARELAGQTGWRMFADRPDTIYYEETMLQGLVIGKAKMDFDERKEYIRRFVPRIDNWAVCDTFCSELKRTVKKEPEAMWQFIQPYLRSSEEFEVRFGVVMLFHFTDPEHIDQLLAYAGGFAHEGYYARMAMAWLLSVCFIKFPEKTMKQLQNKNFLDDRTYNKTLQKIVESLRIPAATKKQIRSMKR